MATHRFFGEGRPLAASRRRWGAAVVVGTLVLSVLAVSEARAETAVYTESITVAAPPASDYSGSSGGDGYDVSLSDDAVYNVYHHDDEMEIACHLQADASNCWDTPSKLITDPDGNTFETSTFSSTHLDAANGHLYAWGLRSSDGAQGVVCIDTTLPPAAADLFCGFDKIADETEHSKRPGEYFSPSNGVVVGSKLYAFVYELSEGVDGTGNTLMCFDMSIEAPCSTPNHDVGLPTAEIAWKHSPIAVIDDRIVIGFDTQVGSFFSCFDTLTEAPCEGNWPFQYPGYYSWGQVYPNSDTSGAVIGMCLPNGAFNATCYDLEGNFSSSPPGAGPAIGTTDFQNTRVVLGDRVYMARFEDNSVRCYDFGVQAQCPNFPLSMSSAYGVYTVSADPLRPSCLWINSDSGSGQIQNFDAFSGAPCGEGATRVLASFVVPDPPECTPETYTSLRVVAPEPGTYDTGTVAFRDADGQPVDGAGDAALDGSGALDLSTVPIGGSRPQFLIALDGLDEPLGEMTVELSWTGEALEQCGYVDGETETSVPDDTTPDDTTPDDTTPQDTIADDDGSESAATTPSGPAVLAQTPPASPTLANPTFAG